MSRTTPRRRLRLYVSYAESDDSYRRELCKHLAPLQGSGQIELWDRSRTCPGEPLLASLHAHLDDADLILLLLSADYLADEAGPRDELTYALARQRRQETTVWPILVRPVAWQSSAVLNDSQLVVWPADSQAVTSAHSRDAAWAALASRIGSYVAGSGAADDLPTRASAVPDASAAELPAQVSQHLQPLRAEGFFAAFRGRGFAELLRERTLLWLGGLAMGGLVVLLTVAANRPLGLVLFSSLLLLGVLAVLVERHSAQSRYLRHLIIEHKHIGLQGLRLGGHVHPDIGRVFVELRIAPAPERERPVFGLLSAQALSGQRSIWDFIRSFDALEEPPGIGLAIIGPPGCGKTTLLRHVAVMLARRQHRAQRVRERTPIFLSLRTCASELGSAAPPNLVELVSRLCIRGALAHLQLPARWLGRQIESGGALVLLDGLDEVGESHLRPAIARWVDEQIRLYPQCLLIVTSRPHGFYAAQLDHVQVLETVPFSGEQIRRFVHNWYLGQEQARALYTRSISSGQARGEAEALIERLGAQTELRELARNPLLLTLIALVHRRGALPKQRAELYDEICKLMLAVRPAQRGKSDTVSLDLKRHVLGSFAVHLMEKRLREVSVGEAVAFLAPLLAAESASKIDAESFLFHIAEESGLLCEPEANRIGFAHLTFQEYLTSRHWIRAGAFSLPLAQLVADPWWHESLRLWAAQSDASELVRVCLRSDSVPALFLASVCLQEAKALDDQVRDQAQAALVAALESGAGERFRLAAEVRLRRRLRELIPLDDERALDAGYLTQAEYQLFLDEVRVHGEYLQPDHWCALRFPAGQGLRPVTGVRPSDVLRFCAWLSARVGDGSFRLPVAQEAILLSAREDEGLGTWVSPADLIGLPESTWEHIIAQAQKLVNLPVDASLRKVELVADCAPERLSVAPFSSSVLDGQSLALDAVFELARRRDLSVAFSVAPMQELASRISALIDRAWERLYPQAARILEVLATVPTAADLLSSVWPELAPHRLQALLVHFDQAPTPALTGRTLVTLAVRLNDGLVAPLDGLRSQAGSLQVSGAGKELWQECLYFLDAALNGCRTILDEPALRKASERADADIPPSGLRDVVATLAEIERFLSQVRTSATQIRALGELGTALRAGDFAQARREIRQAAGSKTAGVPKRIMVLAACLDGLAAHTAALQRTAARRTLVRILQDSPAPGSPGVRRSEAEKAASAAAHLQQELLSFCIVQLAREEGKLPAWEGVRLLHDRCPPASSPGVVPPRGS